MKIFHNKPKKKNSAQTNHFVTSVRDKCTVTSKLAEIHSEIASLKRKQNSLRVESAYPFECRFLEWSGKGHASTIRFPSPKCTRVTSTFFCFCFCIFASVYKMMMDDCFGVFRTTEKGHFPGLSTLFSSFFDLRVLLEDDLWHAWPRGFSGGVVRVLVRGAFTSLWTCDRKWRMKNCYFFARSG